MMKKWNGLVFLQGKMSRFATTGPLGKRALFLHSFSSHDINIISLLMYLLEVQMETYTSKVFICIILSLCLFVLIICLNMFFSEYENTVL